MSSSSSPSSFSGTRVGFGPGARSKEGFLLQSDSKEHNALSKQCWPNTRHRKLTWFGALGCPVTELPTPEARILDWGPGLPTPETFRLLPPFLFPRLGEGAHDGGSEGHRGRGGRGGKCLPPPHLPSEESAPQGRAPDVALLLQVEPNVIAPVPHSWPSRDAQACLPHGVPTLA